jgi:hypothetical protein
VLLPEWHLLGNARSDHFAWNLEITRVPTIRDPIARPPRGKRSLASGDFHPPQFVARNFVPFERSLIGGLRRALGGEHTRSRTASYTFGADESGNLGVAIVVRHDLPFPRDNSEQALFCAVPWYGTGSGNCSPSYELFHRNI